MPPSPALLVSSQDYIQYSLGIHRQSSCRCPISGNPLLCSFSSPPLPGPLPPLFCNRPRTHQRSCGRSREACCSCCGRDQVVAVTLLPSGTAAHRPYQRGHVAVAPECGCRCSCSPSEGDQLLALWRRIWDPNVAQPALPIVNSAHAPSHFPVSGRPWPKAKRGYAAVDMCVHAAQVAQH